MTKKTVVIRLNYKSDKRPKAMPETDILSEWNIRRIAGASLMMAVLAGAAFWYLWKSMSPPKPTVPLAVSNKQAAPVQSSDVLRSVLQPTVTAKAGQPFGEVRPSNGQADTDGVLSDHGTDLAVNTVIKGQVVAPPDPRIVQALLSKAVYNRRPVGTIDSSVYAQPDRAVGVYYFTELKGMTGQRISHEWWREGKLIFKKSVTIRRDPSIFYTSKLVNTNMLGTWQVYLKDSEGRAMDQRRFELLAPPKHSE